MPRKLILAAAIAAAAAPALAGGNMEPDRMERWSDLAAIVFGEEARIEPTESLVTLDAPERAQDAALVPVAIATAPDAGVTGLSLIVDENPGPVAAQLRFGPAGDPRALGLRVRVDGYTNIHAVATLADLLAFAGESADLVDHRTALLAYRARYGSETASD